MGAVPALGQHTRALLVESGLEDAAADDAIARGFARERDPSRTTEVTPPQMTATD